MQSKRIHVYEVKEGRITTDFLPKIKFYKNTTCSIMINLTRENQSTYLPWDCETDRFTISFSNKLEAFCHFIDFDITATFRHVADTSLRYITAVVG